MMRKFLKPILTLSIITALIVGVGAATLAASLQCSGSSIAAEKNNKPIYLVILNINDSDKVAAQYLIERETKGEARHIVDRLSADFLKQTGYRYLDGNNLIKHAKYTYYISTLNTEGKKLAEQSLTVNVANIKLELKEKVKSELVGKTLKLTLGPKTDAEGDPLEYCFYIRIPRGGAEMIYKRWQPTVDREEVSLELEDNVSFEWMLVCLEADKTVPGIEEVILRGWSLVEINPSN